MGAWSGGKEKTQREEACFKKQKRGLEIWMEWASASGGRLSLGERQKGKYKNNLKSS